MCVLLLLELFGLFVDVIHDPYFGSIGVEFMNTVESPFSYSTVSIKIFHTVNVYSVIKLSTYLSVADNILESLLVTFCATIQE